MPFKKTQINLSETKQFSKLIVDYINADEKLRKFYSYLPDISSFEQVIEDHSKVSINRELLADVLNDQYASRIKIIETDYQKTRSNIDLLKESTTFTVCTGHQLCLFTGPLYFLYKIISTINLSEALRTKYPQYNFVPVYWMASEDHDFEEINHVHLFGKTLKWNEAAKGAVGRLATSSLANVVEELKVIAGDSKYTDELIHLFEDSYLKHDNLADATRYLVHALFGEYGLVIIDPDDKRFKTEFLDLIKIDIKEQINYKIVNETISELEKIGVKPQVNPREINVFHLTDQDRVRIEQSTTETLSLNPEEYSPNVVLRPLYQQMILPNIAYIGGPGEIAYWLEYKAMFEYHKIIYPALIPRNFAALIDEKSVQQLDKMGFSFTDLFKEVDILIKEYINKNTSTDLSFNGEEAKLTSLFREISEKVSELDPTLKASVEAELQKVLSSVRSIEGKLLRAAKQKQETSLNQIKKLKDKFFPDGNLQERFENFTPYYLKNGKQFIADLKKEFDPLKFEMLILEIKN
ncbi:MAG: bacillithiol biosynthesis cysteine-adding enzyme BshC [Bacteroidetes bacterium]|jgi:bacillithiol biosynthesis cysteine-adding enzyme BshC|nr:bacillithiol biosynthesis cysteine-adding enzyme BshC [Bacteroidota bacterium]